MLYLVALKVSDNAVKYWRFLCFTFSDPWTFICQVSQTSEQRYKYYTGYISAKRHFSLNLWAVFYYYISWKSAVRLLLCKRLPACFKCIKYYLFQLWILPCKLGHWFRSRLWVNVQRQECFKDVTSISISTAAAVFLIRTVYLHQECVFLFFHILHTHVQCLYTVDVRVRTKAAAVRKRR